MPIDPPLNTDKLYQTYDGIMCTFCFLTVTLPCVTKKSAQDCNNYQTLILGLP